MAGVYELTPQSECRRRCQESVRSGFQFGLDCVGSSLGLMVVLVALGVMNITWMALVAVAVLAQKLLPRWHPSTSRWHGRSSPSASSSWLRPLQFPSPSNRKRDQR